MTVLRALLVWCAVLCGWAIGLGVSATKASAAQNRPAPVETFAARPALHLIPEPAVVTVWPNCKGPELSDLMLMLDFQFYFEHPQHRLSRGAAGWAKKWIGPDSFAFHAASGDRGLALLGERWRALGVRRGNPWTEGPVPGRIVIDRNFADKTAGAYQVDVSPSAVDVRAATQEGAFYGLVTLGQLARSVNGGWSLPCVHIEDRPALRWRILSDDISRGPLPTMRYFKERIRTIASFKMNGYAPYAEHVVLDPKNPLPAPLDGLTTAELRELDAYARRYHVALIPQQQTFAHMHNSLRWERYAPLAETPHGYLVSPANPAGVAYAQDLIRNQLSAVPHPPFFHIGADEPVDLGRGQAKSLVEREGEGPVYTRFVTQMAQFAASHGTRPMIWDDALSRHPELFASLPKSLVFVNWHYGDEATFAPYIKRIADGGFEQMVAPGSRNWNEIYPDLTAAMHNIDRFVSEGKSAHVLGVYQTVWHDDGETLFEATWLPVVYAAANAWQSADVNRSQFLSDFPQAFFGADDARYAADLTALADARDALKKTDNSGDYLFWSDPFDSRFYGRVAPLVDAAALRLRAESVIEHLRVAPPPPLHANAAAVMHLAARRYDTLGRNLQIAKEARDLYADAAAQLAAKKDSFVERDLFLTKYLFWEQRDAMLELAPLVESAWDYENRASHQLSVLERYHLAAVRDIERADRVNRAVYEFVEPAKLLPPFACVLAPDVESGAAQPLSGSCR